MEEHKFGDKERIIVSIISGIEDEIDDVKSERRKFRQTYVEGCSSLDDEAHVLRVLLTLTEDLEQLYQDRKEAIDLAHFYYIDPKQCFEKARKQPVKSWIQESYEKQEPFNGHNSKLERPRD